MTEFHEFPKMVYGPDQLGVIVQDAAEEAALLAKVQNQPAEVNTVAPIRHVLVHEPPSEPEPAAEAEKTDEERREAKNQQARERRAAAKEAREGK